MRAAQQSGITVQVGGDQKEQVADSDPVSRHKQKVHPTTTVKSLFSTAHRFLHFTPPSPPKKRMVCLRHSRILCSSLRISK